MKYTLKAIAVTAMALAAGAAFAQKGETVRIAFMDPLSGPFANVGQNQLKSWQFAAEKLSAKSAAGVKFEVVGFDNKGSPQESLNTLKAAVDQGFRYVVQGNGSGAGLAILDAVSKHNERNPGKEVIYLNYAAVDPAMTNEKCDYWHFRFLDNSDMKLEALTTYMAKDPAIKSVYLIGQNYAYGQQISKSARDYLAKKRPDIRIVGDDLHPIGQVKDFSPYIAKIKSSGADVVLTGNWGPDFTLLIKAAKESGLTVPFYAFSAIQYGAGTPVGENGVGRLKSMAPWHANIEGFQGADYVDGFRQKYKEDFFVMSSRTIVTMMAQAVKTAQSAEPLKVAYALEGMKIAGPAGEIEMRASDHQVQQALYIVDWAKVNGKDVKYDMENTGFGWRTGQKIDAFVAAQPTSCQMKRPARL